MARENTELRSYFVTDGGEWASLVFHYNRQKAKVLAYNNWLTETNYIWLRVRRAPEKYDILKKEDSPHVIFGWDYEDHPDLDEFSSWSDYLEVYKKEKGI